MKPRSLLAVAAVACAVAISSAAPVRAGDNTPGPYHENKLVGFRFRPLNEWAPVPQGTDPDDPKVAEFYSDKGKFVSNIRPTCEVHAFKRSGDGATSDVDAPEDGEPAGKGEPPSKDEMRKALMDSLRSHDMRDVLAKKRDRDYEMAEQLLTRLDEKKQAKVKGKDWRAEPREKQYEGKDVTLTYIDADTVIPVSNGEVWKAKYFVGFIENDEYQVGVIYWIPDSEVKKYTQGVIASLRSLEFLDGAEIADARQDLAAALAGKTGDERWLEEIKRKVTEGWAYLQTKNYLIVYDKAVKPDRIRLIAKQIEAIRLDVYEVLFPPDREITAISVVRVCKDKEQYVQYGGSSQSAGYWYWVAKELVFYEDTSAKKDSLRVLNHEAFHQYIFYSVGSISPHDWFNEGHGDFFSGHDYSPSGKFIPKPFDWRRFIKGVIGQGKHVPLKRFVTLSHQEYYGPQISQNYAQGWSLIWFLRMQRGAEYSQILPTYFNTLKGEVSRYRESQIEAQKAAAAAEGKPWDEKSAGDIDIPPSVEEAAREKALDAAFGKFSEQDWDRFEKAYRAFKY